MGKRTGFRQHATPPPPGFHEYAEAAAEWFFRYKFTVLVAVALVVGAVVLWAGRGSSSGKETRAWKAYADAATPEELEQSLPRFKGTSAYPWAALRLGTFYYDRERYQDAERVLEPLTTDEQASAYPRGLALYVLGCTYVEMGHEAQAKNSFEKALTVNGQSPFLKELVAREEAALKDWPPKESSSGETTTQPAAAGGGETTVQPPATGGGETTIAPPALGGETGSGASTGKP